MSSLVDTTTLSWITAEVDQALERVRHSIAGFAAAPGDSALLVSCAEHLHQVSGALNMVGLAEATQFCETLEGCFATPECASGGAAALDVLDRGVLALKAFVDGVARGEPNVPARLYPAYRELASLQGRDACAEKELFFPDLTRPAPAHPRPARLEAAALPAFLLAQRARFQRGLLAWLRQAPGGLDEMRGSLDAMHSVAAQLPERRALWWVAAALIDALQEAGDAEWLSQAKALCKKLDIQVRDLAAGSRTVGEPLLRELLYAIACSDAGSQALKEVRHRFRLDGLLPGAQPLAPDPGALPPAARSQEEPPPGPHADLTQKISATQLRAQVAREITANLQQVEQVLDAHARGTTGRDSLPALVPQLRQIHGAFAVLGLERASAVLTACETMLQAPGEIDMDRIAEGLGSLGFYLEPCLQGREPREQAIDFFLERLGQRAAPPPPQEAPAPASQDEELLQIFLEEAGEVLAGIEAALPACRAEPGNTQALATLRRGFHTLKGSGRMVGLNDLGEVAWEIEQVMNRWLEESLPASPELLELAGDAARCMADWVAQLANGQPITVDAGAITKRARALGTEAPRPAFLEVYLNEAAGHVATLVARYRPAAALPDDFIRAAHTLAGSSRTAGFAAVADLSGALEQWIPFASRATEPAEVALAGAVIEKLQGMVAALQRGEPPGDAGDTLGRMQQLTARCKAQRILRDDIDVHLLPVFLEEAAELVPQIGGDLRDWKALPGDERIADALKRALHTLKGSARMAGAIRLGELTHLMESQVEAAQEAGSLPPELFDELEAKMDRISADLDRMKERSAPAPAPEAVAEPVLPAAAAMLRVNADMLDFLITESGEVAIARSRIEAELRLAKQSLGELEDSVARLRSQLREVEVQADSQMQSRRSVLDERDRDFDPLEFDRYTRLQELTRMMAEGLSDATSIQQALTKNLDETDAALQQQARIGRGLQQDLMRMRALPFATLGERLHRVVRQAVRETGRRAELAIQGAQIELDRSVLERIAAPLEHMLRNAVVHGVEDAPVRSAAGKPETARISIELRQEANEIVIIVADDGAGLDVEALRAKAVEKGLLAADRELGEEEQNELVFLPGLSTAGEVTELAGRGVGMDVVRTEITAVHGRIDIASTRGKGTTFTIFVPLTLAVTQTVMVQAGTTTLAVSSATVEQVLRLKADALAGLYEQGRVEFQGRAYPLHSLRQLLGERVAVEIRDYNSVLLLRSGIQRVAVHVDELLGNREVVVKAIGPQLSRIPGVTGATVLANGAVVLIVNPVQLAQRQAAAGARLAEATGVIGARASTPLVMVVDDSLTVRKFTSRLLEREGYRVVTAKDGVDAIDKLKESLPDVMLVDIEMPRMDGFDLTRNVRGDPRTHGVPIIVISSRTAEKHRSRAAELGVDAFVGKPYQEAELLGRIGACLRRP